MTSVDEKSKTPDQCLDALADALVANHLRLTLEDDAQLQKFVLMNEYGRLAGRRHRVIVVVGAGASIAAGIPSTEEAIETLNIAVAHANSGTVQQMAERLYGPESDGHGSLDPAQFETMLHAACKNGLRNEVILSLKDLFDIPFRPTLAYELLAHMLKHRFMDAIVNFNFDEALDRAIEDELGAGRYHHIVSDGDCRLLEKKSDAPVEYSQPIYLKPHGTVSAPASMRFTLADYRGVTPPIKDVLCNLLRDRPVTLVAIGFNMQSAEFNKIVDRRMRDTACAIYNLTLEDDPIPRPTCGDHCETLYSRGGHIVVDTTRYTIDARLKSLWSKVEQRFESGFTPRGIERHELISQLIPPGKSIDWNEQALYLKRRAVVELALATAKAKCFVATRVLLSGRAGTYLHLYQKHVGRSNADWQTIYDMCLALGLKVCSFTREVLSLPGLDGRKAQPEAMPLNDIGRTQLEKLADCVAQRGILSEELCAQVGRVLVELHKYDEVEVVSPRLTMGLELCKDPKHFNTLTALKAHSAWAIENKGWDTLLCVAETGQWLNNDKMAERFKKMGRRLGLIVADDTLLGEIRKRYGDSLQIPRKPLDWWLHNQHVTIFVENGVPTKAFHFERRLRSPRIAPVMLTQPDAKYVMKCFFAYWVKAERYTTGVVTDEEIEDAERNFFPKEKPIVSVFSKIVTRLLNFGFVRSS